jgi:hypothetical protein
MNQRTPGTVSISSQCCLPDPFSTNLHPVRVRNLVLEVTTSLLLEAGSSTLVLFVGMEERDDSLSFGLGRSGGGDFEIGRVTHLPAFRKFNCTWIH